MSTQQTAKTRFVDGTTGTKFAYRRLGTHSGIPLVLLTHFRGVIDKWDPLLINSLAAKRSLILVDYVGVGLSEGETATTIRQTADQLIEFLQLINEPVVDIFGYSIGGGVAQLVALNADPAVLKVRKLILAGTGTSAGPDTVASPNEDVATWAGAPDVGLANFQTLFFPKTKAGTRASEAWWDRIHERSEATSGEVPAQWLSLGYADGGKGLQAQISQMTTFGGVESSRGLEGAYDRLHELDIPVLVANGHDDYMIPTVNSWVIQQKVPNGTLVVYPDSGHGFLFQYADQFAKHAVEFLEI